MDEQEKEIEEILGTFDKAPSPSSERNNQAQIRQNNLQSRQVSPKPIDTERTVRTFNQTSNKRQTPSGKGIYLSPKRKAVIKRRKRQSGFFKILKSKTLPRNSVMANFFGGFIKRIEKPQDTHPPSVVQDFSK